MKGAFASSVRRELWEHRAVILAPLFVAGLVVVSVLLGAFSHGPNIGPLLKLDAAKLQSLVVMPFGLSASVVLFVSFAIGAYYAFDALNAERRDRSILFWKSMPVSDATTVLSKAFIPLAVQPAVGVAIALALQAILAVLLAAILSATGVDVGRLWAMVPAGPMTIALLYGVFVHVLWYAPLYALFLMLSAWVRRPFLWVLVPALAVQLLEKIAFGTSWSGTFLRHRLLGALSEAFVPNALNKPITSLAELDPVRFLTSPGLWLGLLFAAGFLYAAIYLRRSREPL
jgi:ABC-2 type transport system permease protein